MANEAVIIERYGYDGAGGIVRRTVASNAAISFGSLLKFTDPNTVALSTSVIDVFGGIAAMEKKNNDYSTTISVFTDVVADLKASGAVAIGELVALNGQAGLNYVSSALAIPFVSYACVVGAAQETGSTNETIRVRVSPIV